MPDPTLSEALAEAYASAPSDMALIETMSFWYDGLMVDGEPSEIYIYQGFEGDRTSAEGVPLKDFVLEPAARYFGGQQVEFVAIPFTVVLPQVSAGQLAKGQLIVDGVGREIADVLMDAVAAGQSIEVTYRAYIEGMEADGPQNDPPIVFALQGIQVNAVQVRGDITAINVGNKRFPADIYRPARFPALR